MRLKIVFKSSFGLTVPRNYQANLQRFILESAKQGGFKTENFTDYNFSMIKGNFNANKDKTISFVGEFNFYVASYDKAFLVALDRAIDDTAIFDGEEIKVISKTLNDYGFKFEKYVIKTLSPVTVYKKINNKTVFYNPDNKEFKDVIIEHLKEKYQTNEDIIDMYGFKNIKKVVTRFNDTIVEAYSFECTIEGDKTYLKKIYNDGLGNRCNQGFGMVLFGN